MKKWAFYKENNEWHRIGARAAINSEKLHPGEWKNRTYYSTHFPPENRLKMNLQRSSKQKPYFAYNPRHKKDVERLGGGESLAHYLYKIAISELNHTTLKLPPLKQDININITHSETEKHVNINDYNYYLDVFLKFTSDSSYQSRWSGRLGVEVHNTNPVQGKKLAHLTQCDIPLIEVHVNEKLSYQVEEEDSTEKSERAYIEHLKTYLSDFMWGKLLIDSKSKEFLEQENLLLTQELEEAKNELRATDKALNIEKAQRNNIQTQLTTAEQNVQKHSKALNTLFSERDKLKNMGVFRFVWFKITGK